MVERPEYLRLFPLQSVVLFPGMELPLVVFEPRYLQLTQECTEAGEPFGVVLLKEGREVGPNPTEPFEIGTTAWIDRVSSAGDGRLSVSAVGRDRFRVLSFDHSNPYLAAEVEYIDDSSTTLVEPSLVTNVTEDAVAFVRTLIAMRGGFVRDVQFPEEPAELSFHVAQLFQGNPEIQQRLLERDTFDRLWEELSLIKSAKEQLVEHHREDGPGTSFSPN